MVVAEEWKMHDGLLPGLQQWGEEARLSRWGVSTNSVARGWHQWWCLGNVIGNRSLLELGVLIRNASVRWQHTLWYT